MTVSKEDLIVNTFYITYVFLITTGTITFIESLRTKEEKVRNILNLETCISVIAALFYGKFVQDLDKGIDYKKINETRYVDWAITTPIMLLVLILAFLFNNKEGAFSFSKYLLDYYIGPIAKATCEVACEVPCEVPCKAPCEVVYDMC